MLSSEFPQFIEESITCSDNSAMLLYGMTTIENIADSIIQEIPRWSDDKIIEAAQQAAKLDHQAFRIRGACASELLSRATKLLGGRGKKDEEHEGKGAILAQIAKEFRVDARTIRDDVSILAEFPELKTSDAEISSFSRRMLLTASKAPNPHAALELIAKKGDGDLYPERYLVADVKALNSGTSLEEIEESRWITYRISLEAYDALKIIAEQNSELPEATLERIILERKNA